VDEEERPPSPTAVSYSSPSRGGFVGGEPRARCLRRPDSVCPVLSLCLCVSLLVFNKRLWKWKWTDLESNLAKEILLVDRGQVR
jgi:hypothetical protein